MRKHLPFVVVLSLLATPTAMRADEQNQNSDFNPSCGLLGKFVRYRQHYQHCKPQIICNDRGVCRRKPTNSTGVQVTEDNPAAVSDGNPSLTASASIAAGATIAGASASASATADASAGAGGTNASGSGQGSASAGGGSLGAGGGLGVGGL